MKNRPRFSRFAACSVVVSAILLNATPVLTPEACAADLQGVSAINTDAKLTALVPDVYRKKQTLTVAVNPEIAPIKFVNDDGEIAGFTPDLLSAAAKVLGLNVNFVQSSFDALIPGLIARRYDVLLSLGDFPERHSKVTFIDYLNVGQTIVGAPKRGLMIRSLNDLCGLNVAIPRATAQAQKANEISSKCVADGRKPINVATYPDTNMTLLALSNDSSEAAWVDSPAAGYNTQKFPEKYQAAYFYYNGSYGMGFSADESGNRLAVAFQHALLELQQDGIYDKLMRKWGLPVRDGRPTFPINDPMR